MGLPSFDNKIEPSRTVALRAISEIIHQKVDRLIAFKVGYAQALAFLERMRPRCAGGHNLIKNNRSGLGRAHRW
jgi:hypothetical protein